MRQHYKNLIKTKFLQLAVLLINIIMANKHFLLYSSDELVQIFLQTTATSVYVCQAQNPKQILPNRSRKSTDDERKQNKSKYFS